MNKYQNIFFEHKILYIKKADFVHSHWGIFYVFLYDESVLVGLTAAVLHTV